VIVVEWKAVVTGFTELAPHLHHCTCSGWKATNLPEQYSKLQQIVMISTCETYQQQVNQEEAGHFELLSPGIVYEDIMKVTHSLITSRTRIGMIRRLMAQWLQWTPKGTVYIWHLIY